MPIFLLPHTLQAFRNPGYGEYFGTQFVSNIGNHVQVVAQAWLIYRLTGSPELLGLTAFVNQLPFLLLGPLSGAIADRYDRRVIMLITHAISVVLAIGLGLATLLHQATPALILIIAALSGIVSAVDIPTRQALLRDIVGLKDLPQAVTLNLSMLNAARIFGPAVGSVLILWLGEGGCFVINGLSYGAVIMCLMRLKLRDEKPVGTATPFFTAITEGFQFVRTSRAIQLTLLISAVAGLFATPYASLLPVFADQVLKGGPQTLGLLLSAAGLGAFAGAVVLSLVRSGSSQGLRLVASTLALGACIAIFAFAGVLWLALVVMVITGIAQITHMTSGTVNVQAHSSDALRGRVLALFGMVQQGVPPFGALLAGLLAGQIGVAATLMISGGLCCFVALFFLKFRRAF